MKLTPQKMIRVLFVLVLVTTAITVSRKLFRKSGEAVVAVAEPQTAPVASADAAPAPAAPSAVAKAPEAPAAAPAAPAAAPIVAPVAAPAAPAVAETKIIIPTGPVSMPRFSKHIFPSKTVNHLSSKLAVSLIKTKDYQASRKILEDVLRSEKKNPDLLNNLAYVLGEQGELQKSEEVLRVAVEASDKCAECRNNLGNLLVKQGKLDEARVLMQQAIAISPKYVDALLTLGLICEYQNDWKAAHDTYRQVQPLIEDDELKKIIGVRVLWMSEIVDGTRRDVAQTK